MKCPYIIKVLKYIKDSSNNLINEETGIIKSNKEVYIEVREYIDCDDSCAVKINNECNYNK